MSEVDKRAEIAADVAEVFAYVDDFTHARDWIVGLDRIQHVAGEAHGVGAQYEGTVRVGVSLHARLECTSWKQDSYIELQSVDGPKNTQRWEFRSLGEGRCEIRALITYEFPGGPAGAAVARAVSPVVGSVVDKSAANLVAKFES